MSEDPSTQYWYNTKTGEVEKGYVTNSADRVGPFPTHEEAEHALEKLRANSAKWAEEDARDDR
ncbi:SPOR domain-containing protein [Herbiconiux sp. YIM B11900]|uniref:SPOR domain-containing protein n=1 Tax=Herbiconiux sp. YIM B11900 TaxID=3404131 RepID=UPI003F867660